MGRYAVKRIFQGLITWFIATATFAAMHAVPGDPLSNEKATTEAIQRTSKPAMAWTGPYSPISTSSFLETWRRETSACPSPSKIVG